MPPWLTFVFVVVAMVLFVAIEAGLTTGTVRGGLSALKVIGGAALAMAAFAGLMWLYFFIINPR